jgi:hypothetical protein
LFCLFVHRYVNLIYVPFVQVKTTAAKRYVVRPPQGYIEPGQQAIIKLIIVQKDAESLWQDRMDGKARGEGELKCDDKFLVQTTVVSAAFCKAELADKDDKEIIAPLQKLYTTLAEDDKKSGKNSFKSSKRVAKFAFPEDPLICVRDHACTAIQDLGKAIEALEKRFCFFADWRCWQFHFVFYFNNVCL